MQTAAGGAEPDRADGRVRDLRALYALTDRVYRAQSDEDVYAAALDAITESLGCDRASILLFDDAGVMQFVAWRGLSEAYRETLKGHTPWSPKDVDPDPIYVEDIAESAEADWVKKQIAEEGIVSLGFIPLTLRGNVIGKFMTYHGVRSPQSTHQRDLAITIARQLSFAIERSRSEAERKTVLEDLRLSEQRFRTMSENAPVMIWTSDPSGACQHLNRMLRDFWGVAEEDLPSFDWRATMHPEDAAEIGAAIGDAIAGRQSVQIKGRYKGPGEGWYWLQTDAHPRFAADGSFLGMIGVNVDITRQEEIATQRETMLAELNHRVKNTLAVVQAIAHQTFNGDTSPVVETFKGRISTLARAHNILTRTNWESTPLMQLAQDTLVAGKTDGERYSMDGPAVVLSPKQTLALALALHELQTNALKHGCLTTPKGKVALTWAALTGDEIEVVWREEGGPVVTPPKSRGFGTTLIERVLAADLEGAVTLDFAPGGLVCTIRAPLARRTGAIA